MNFKHDREEILRIYNNEISKAEAARKYAELKGIPYSETLRKYVSKVVNKAESVSSNDLDLENETVTETNQYRNDSQKSQKGFTAIDDNGSLMSIERYCEYYGLDVNKIRSYKLVSHTSVPFYNIAFYTEVIEPAVTQEELKSIIFEELAAIKYTPIVKEKVGKTGVVKISDLHLGSYVDNLIRTKDFSINILANKLIDAAVEVNNRGYSKVHVHILGDLIESFTGLSHKNTWKGLDKAMVGSEAVKLVTRLLHENFLSKIENLAQIKVVAGNHDRVTSDNKEDVQGGAADLVCWGLGMIGYDVEFNPLVLTHVVDNICHIITHGHHAISKRSTKQLCWDYGRQGMYNLICEGHLHSIIERLNINQRSTFQTVKDDAVDHRRINLPSFFTGNFFSESLGYTSESGFVIAEDNGKGVPNVFYYAV